MGNTTSNEPMPVRSAEEEEIEDRDEEDFEDDEEEETEEEWRRRREGGSAQSRLDLIKKLLAIAFFAGLGIIVIIVAATATPLITPNPEDVQSVSPTASPTVSPTRH